LRTCSQERHFNISHHPCTQPECRERKFVVFNTPLDLQAHRVEEHGATMSSRDKKDARKVATEFQFEEIGVRAERRGAREHDREPPPGSQTPRSQPDPSHSPRTTPGLTDGTITQSVSPFRSGANSPLVLDTDPAVLE